LRPRWWAKFSNVSAFLLSWAKFSLVLYLVPLHWTLCTQRHAAPITEIGAIFVLFHAGLEVSPPDLIRVGRKALLVAALGIVVPFALGFGYMHWRGDIATESIFVGAAMVATSVGITARVLGDLGVLASRTAKIILGAAVFDDILGMLLLALIEGLAQGGAVQWVRLGILAGEAIVFALFMIFLGPRIVTRIRPGMARLSTHNAPLITALAVCLGLSYASAKIGMAAIIGAFFAGMIFAEYSRNGTCSRGYMPSRSSWVRSFSSPSVRS
jgi:Kef-type K+ transport system membrane component KefB